MHFTVIKKVDLMVDLCSDASQKRQVLLLPSFYFAACVLYITSTTACDTQKSYAEKRMRTVLSMISAEKRRLFKVLEREMPFR